jgi:uncharacterized membrane protein YsdA (DUF1294 family)
MGWQKKGRPVNPILFHGVVGLAVAVASAVALWAGLSRQWAWPPWVLSWLVAINVTAFAYYVADKVQAQNARRRVPELVLHGLALAGGSVGAFAGMQLCRHKTVKGNFRVIFWLIVATQVVFALWAAKEFWWTASPPA